MGSFLHPLSTHGCQQFQLKSKCIILIMHRSWQPGLIYFMTPFKCTVFGVNCEALSLRKQVIMIMGLIVVSRLHFFFENHELAEKQAYLTADNCTGQNNNNYDSLPHLLDSIPTFISSCWAHKIRSRLVLQLV